MTRTRFFLLSAALAALVALTLPGREIRAGDESEKDMKGFSRETVRAEQARIAMEKGHLYMQDKSMDLAREQFMRAAELDRNLIEARFQLGLVELYTAHYNLAVDHFRVVYREMPTRDSLCLRLTESYLGLGECKKAEQWLDRQLTRKKEPVDAAPLWKKIKECNAHREGKSGR